MGDVLLRSIYEAAKGFQKVAGSVAILMKLRSEEDPK